MANEGEWQTVGKSKKSAYREKKAAELARIKAQQAAEEENLSGFNALAKKKKAAPVEDEPAAPTASPTSAAAKKEKEKAAAPKKKSTAEKAAEAKAQRKKQKKMKAAKAAEEAKKAPQFVAPKAAEKTVEAALASIPKEVVEALQTLPEKYPGRAKEQMQTAVLYLNDLFGPGTIAHKNMKGLDAPERWSLPLSEDKKNVLRPLLAPILDQSSDDAMWGSLAKELIGSVFGLNGTRNDEGKHFLGSRFALQVLLRHKPTAFTARPMELEGVFLHEGSLMTREAALNYAWVLGQLGDASAPHFAEAWKRVFFPRIVAEKCKATGDDVDVAFVLAGRLAKLKPSEAVRKQFRHANGSKDPLEKELFAILPLLDDGMKRHLKLCAPSGAVAGYSLRFTPTSPHDYFTKLALLLREVKPAGKAVILDLLTDGIVLDTSCLQSWSADLVVLVDESAQLLTHMAAKKDALSRRLDGEEMAKFLATAASTARGLQDGSISRPEGRRRKLCTFTDESVAELQRAVKAARALTSAVPTEAPEENKKAQQKKKELQARQSGGSGMVLLLTLLLVCWLAFPLLPPEVQQPISSNVAKAYEPLAPHVENLKAQVTAALTK